MAGVVVTAQNLSPYSNLRIAFFSVGERALRAKKAEDALNSADPGDNAALARAQESLADLEFYEDANASVAMKSHLARVVLQRGLQVLKERVV